MVASSDEGSDVLNVFWKLPPLNYNLVQKTRQALHSQTRARGKKFVDILQQTCCQQADAFAWFATHLVDEKSVASCRKTCCKVIVKTCYLQTCYKLIFNYKSAIFQVQICK